jgi:nitrogen fixation protein NifU and related proteins
MRDAGNAFPQPFCCWRAAAWIASTDHFSDMFSEQLIRHFREPRFVGVLPPPASTVSTENPVCGDILQLSGELRDGRLAEVRFQVRGCTAAIAAGSAAATLLQGKTPAEARRIDATMVEQELGGLESASKHAARLAADGIQRLLQTLATQHGEGATQGGEG